MNSADKNTIYLSLRKQYPFFIFEKIEIETENAELKVRFYFNISHQFYFEPEIVIPQKPFLNFQINQAELENLVFHLGMVELVSYWKATCSPQVIIKAGKLNQAQIDWWKKLYFNGLGEFYYLNGIQPSLEDFMKISSTSEQNFHPFELERKEGFLVPIGGGKDSVVTLETLARAGKKVIPFVVNPRSASIDTVKNAGFSEEEILIINRTIDPNLLELNRKGFLNGHTPFSAVLAFNSLLAAKLAGASNIALSNESSANEATVIGTNVNHQYSKSFEFENDFRNYCRNYISEDFNYFSFLRPLNELQIAQAFSKHPQHFTSFKSCNVGSKTDTWCGSCSKCLFTWIIISPFIEQEKLKEIFGKDLFADLALTKTLEELVGQSEVKPFECVGTIEDVNSALILTIYQLEKNNLPLPYLLKHFKTLPQFHSNKNHDLKTILKQINAEHFLSKDLFVLVKNIIA
jgi:hypothetical protein